MAQVHFRFDDGHIERFYDSTHGVPRAYDRVAINVGSHQGEYAVRNTQWIYGERGLDHIDCDLAPLVVPDYEYKGSMEQKWRYAEANVSMLRDAVGDLFTFIQGQFDPNPWPEVAGYLNWDDDRKAALREVLDA